MLACWVRQAGTRCSVKNLIKVAALRRSRRTKRFRFALAWLVLVGFMVLGGTGLISSQAVRATASVGAGPTPPPPVTTPKSSVSGTPPPTINLPAPAPKTKGQPPPGPNAQSGTFYIIWGGNQTLFFLLDDQGRNIRLDIDQKLLQSAGGELYLNRKRVKLTGTPTPTRNNAQLLLTVNTLSPEAQPGTQGLGPEGAISGSRPFVNVLCKFSDSPGIEPETPAYFTGLMSDTYPGMSHYFREASFGTINLVGTVTVGWNGLPHPRVYYLDPNSNGLNWEAISSDCLATADPTVNFNNFQGINLMFNADLGCCAWGGAWGGTLDDTTKAWPMTWMPPWGYNSQTILAHEMGHAFGMPHSASSTGQTYNNVWDVMSDDWSNCSLPGATDATYGCLGQQEIAFHKDIPGWIPAARKKSVGSGSQTLTLERLAQPGGSGYLMATVPIAGSSSNFYTVEARYRVGYDRKTPANAVVIHSVDTTRLDPAWVMDSDDPNITNDAGTQWIPGETFRDTANAISVKVESATASGFVVTITNGSTAATEIGVDAALPTNGNIGVAGASNWFHFQVETAGAYTLETGSGSLTDTFMGLYGPTNRTTLLASDDDSGAGNNARITVCLQPGSYFASVRAHSPTATGSYNLRLTSLRIGQGSSYSPNFQAAYDRLGGSDRLGCPTATVQNYPGTNVKWQSLAYGLLFHDQAGGSTPATIRAFGLSGSLANYYLGLGGPTSWLGVPTSDQFSPDNYQYRVNFANGFLIDNNGTITATAWPSNFGAWKTKYYNNSSLSSGPSLVVNEGSSATPGFSHSEWPTWLPPLPAQGLIYSENWSASWERNLTVGPGSSQITLCGDDGVRLYWNGLTVIDQWQQHGLTCFDYTSPVYAGPTSVNVKIEYFQLDGGAGISFAAENGSPPLLTPANLRTTATGLTGATLAWDYSGGSVSSFFVQRSLGASGVWEDIPGQVAGNATSFQVNNLLTGRLYRFRVKAVGNGDESAYSDELSLTTLGPRSPTLVLAAGLAGKVIRLDWLDNASNETGFRLQYRLQNPSPGSFSDLALVNLPDLGSFTYFGDKLAPETAYCFQMQATNADGNSNDSNQVCGTTLAADTFMVIYNEDNGLASPDLNRGGTLSFALSKATAADSNQKMKIIFDAGLTTLTIKGNLPDLQAGVSLIGSCTNPVVLDGSGLLAGDTGLKLGGHNYLEGLSIVGFRGKLLDLNGTKENTLKCVSLKKKKDPA